MSRTTPKAVLVLLATGALLVLGGLAVLAWNVLLGGRAGPPSEFGWFAYAAPAGDSEPAFYVVTRRDLWGAAVVVLGLVSVAAAAGFLAGGRRAAGAAGVPPPG